MDFTILAVVLLLGVGVPIRNKLIRKYRDKSNYNNRHQASPDNRCQSARRAVDNHKDKALCVIEFQNKK